ncbi:HugZ family protein [Pseudoroseomonas cervicalis]|uniref:HugZ family pyridoxamine 5'-phosphate oxidase n=1 Tax=Teichococcus cervicalis TaxID=204525 RepID=UPI00277D4F1F|nr:DUF2470 domain-containing protein [Pseudoroseomonas cervicalis]MDQ1081093.1 putative heme iron utilization protein [Pseudoroseomonas cervicalis]
MDKVEAVRQARGLLRGARSGVLATQAEGQPFAALVTPAMAGDLSVLLWLSRLSEHTRQLSREPRCALLVQGRAAEANPQTAPRLSLTGLAETVEGGEAAALKARWLALHPYAALYAGFGDFALWRIRPQAALLVGGFAAATRLRAAELLPDPNAVAAIEAAEPGICAHMNEDHADAMARIATGLLGQEAAAWRMVAVDVDGCDMAAGDAVCRLDFAAPVTDSNGVRMALVAAARQAREAG